MAKLTLDEIMAAAERDDGTGFCRACGAEQDGVEPDARNYRCEVCGAHKVYGAEELLIMGAGDNDECQEHPADHDYTREPTQKEVK